jgi:hypothetical protein
MPGQDAVFAVAGRVQHRAVAFAGGAEDLTPMLGMEPAVMVKLGAEHGTIKRGTLGSILRQANLTPAEFLKLLV